MLYSLDGVQNSCCAENCIVPFLQTAATPAWTDEESTWTADQWVRGKEASLWTREASMGTE